jgi:hypothetical protein
MIADSVRAGWGEGVLAGSNPSLRHDPEAHRWLARWERASVPRGHAYAWRRNVDYDVRSLLPSIQAPTLTMHHPGNVLAPPPAAVEYVTHAITGAVGPRGDPLPRPGAVGLAATDGGR